MLPIPIYYALLTLCWVYAMASGGKPERIGATIMVVGSALTLVASATSGIHLRSVETGVLIIDVVVFAAFTILAARADRFWPIWVSALMGLGILGHLSRWYAGAQITWQAYAVSIIVWSYPILALIAIGTFHHQRRAGLRFGGIRRPGQVEP